MSLLDARQRAMLQEMGIRLFLPETPVEEPAFAEEPALTATVLAEAPVRARSAPLLHEPVRREPPIPAAVPRQGLAGIAAMDWDALRETVAACQACKLCEGRRNTVFGVGDLQADWLVVGDSPDENEDLQGEPFVGQAGKLLDNMLAALGLGRTERVYIANVLKCRPPGNRNPEPEEIAQCEPFLRRQVELLRPKIILAMGRFAVQALLQTSEPVGRLRGRVHRYHEVPVVVTYHPTYLLRNLPDKAKAWSDLVLAQSVLRAS
jgi:uracil-DNA glycosylase